MNPQTSSLPNPLWTGLYVALGLVALGFAWQLLWKDPPGTELHFVPGFVGPYCIVVSPQHPEASTNSEGYLVIAVPQTGVAYTSSDLPGKPARGRAFFMDPSGSQPLKIAPETPCGSWTIGDRSISMGRVGEGECIKPKMSDRAPSFEEALAWVCRKQ